jgi:phage/plasmid primase-like uncharacterized protein
MNNHRHLERGPTIAELLAAACGQWLAILAAAGLPENLLNGKGHPCPRCGGNNRFASFPDVAERGSVHCRTCFNSGTNPRPGDGLATLRWFMGCDTATACRWLAGWLGLGAVVHRTAPPPIIRTLTLDNGSDPDGSLAELTERWRSAMTGQRLAALAEQLGLPHDALERQRVGFHHDQDAYAWPMVDEIGRVVGVRLRSRTTGEKWSVKGGKSGLFVPDGLPESVGRLYVTEGPTDCAALLSIGLAAIARPSCNDAVVMTCKKCQALHLSECVIVADDDENGAGKRGAESLACVLVTVCRSVRIVYPPEGFKDARAWITGGAGVADVETLVAAAVVNSLSIQWKGLR